MVITTLFAPGPTLSVNLVLTVKPVQKMLKRKKKNKEKTLPTAGTDLTPFHTSARTEPWW